MTSIREQCTVTLEKSRPPGGQQVGCDPGVIIVTHETGITVRLPPMGRTSQHKRIAAAVDAIEYLLVCG